MERVGTAENRAGAPCSDVNEIARTGSSTGLHIRGAGHKSLQRERIESGRRQLDGDPGRTAFQRETEEPKILGTKNRTLTQLPSRVSWHGKRKALAAVCYGGSERKIKIRNR
jgi:hypothetical protein